MPRIDFYILPELTPDSRELLACRLAEKAYRLGHRIYIHTACAEQARLLDDLLWTFRPGSFVPHALYPLDCPEAPPVLIGWQPVREPALAVLGMRADTQDSQGSSIRSGEAKVLINLASEVPAGFEHFDRVAELVNQDPQVLEQSRERFRYYRDRDYIPESHKL